MNKKEANELNSLIESCLRQFIKLRLVELEIGDIWKEGLESFVNEKYVKYRANYSTLHRFFQMNEEKNVSIDMLDTTALLTLVFYYPGFSPITIFEDDSISKNIMTGLNGFLNSRNALVHESEIVTDELERSSYYNHLIATSNIISFASMCADYYYTSNEEFKNYLRKATVIMDQLRTEKWYLTEEEKKHVILAEEDVYKLQESARQGNKYAALKLGKIYLDEKRPEHDEDKGFYWIKKAYCVSPEAQYYYALCFHKGYGTAVDDNKAIINYSDCAKNGDINAQRGLLDILVYSDLKGTYISEDERKDIMDKYIPNLIEHEDPESLYLIGQLYLKTGKDPLEYYRRPATLGYERAVDACINYAKQNKRNSDELIKWCKFAIENDMFKNNLPKRRHIEYFLKRNEPK